MLPYDLHYSLWGPGILGIDTQLNFLEIKWIYILLNPTNALWKGSHQFPQGSLKACFLITALSPLGGGTKFSKFIEFSS